MFRKNQMRILSTFLLNGSKSLVFLLNYQTNTGVRL